MNATEASALLGGTDEQHSRQATVEAGNDEEETNDANDYEDEEMEYVFEDDDDEDDAEDEEEEDEDSSEPDEEDGVPANTLPRFLYASGRSRQQLRSKLAAGTPCSIYRHAYPRQGGFP